MSLLPTHRRVGHPPPGRELGELPANIPSPVSAASVTPTHRVSSRAPQSRHRSFRSRLRQSGGYLRRRPTSSVGRGQSLVEFALVLPLLLILVLGIVQFGFLFGTHIGLVNGTREGARYGSTVPTTDGSTAAAVQNHLWNGGTSTGALAQVMGFTSGSLASRTVTYCKYQTSNNNWHVRLRATVVYNHPLFVPIIGAMLDPLDSPSTPGVFQLSVAEEMRVENSASLTTAPSVGDC